MSTVYSKSVSARESFTHSGFFYALAKVLKETLNLTWGSMQTWLARLVNFGPSVFFYAAAYYLVAGVGQSVSRIFAVDGRGEASDEDGFPNAPSMIVRPVLGTISIKHCIVL